MDVVCGRCRAEYEFDDALISERGTTVRCTNCGLQFKVFPPVGQRAPEVWMVFDPRDQRVEPVRYDSLREMQKDIARGVVTAEHLLARGDEAPRPLREIVELQPLLHQPKSEPPPAPDSVPEPVAPPPKGMKTVLGVAQRPDPSAAAGAPAPPRPPIDSSGDLDEHAVVPGDAFERHSPVPFPKEGDHKPRIRSALSMSPSTVGAASRADHDANSDELEGRGSIAPPRQSLRSTLAGAPASQRLSPVPQEAGPPSSKGGPPHSERGDAPPPSEGKVPQSKQEAATLPPVEEKSGPSEKPAPAPGNSTSAAITAPVEPKITESDEYAGQMTPTPSGMRAYRSPDAEPVSSIAGVHVKQRARTGGIILAVLVGGGAFLGFANRDKLTGAVTEARQDEAEPEVASLEVPADLSLRLQMADAAWISATLLDNPGSVFTAPSEVEVQKLESELAALGAKSSWEKVNLLRVSGRLGEARKASGSLQKGAEQSYALALLDLAEEEEDPPWPVVIERLREASSGERGRFLARSVYIYALATSGALPRAVADFEAFGQLAGGQEAPLYEELHSYLERLGAFEDKTEDEAMVAPVEETRPEEEEPFEEAAAEETHPSEPAEKIEPRPKEEPAVAAPKPKVSEAMKSKVAQADAMWRGGNQEGALVIYREVVAEVGTKNFLGQRSAARIAQAARERAGAQ